MIYTAEEVREKLRQKVEEAGSQGRAASLAHVSRGHINCVLNGEPPGIRIAQWLGLRRVIAYVAKSE